jgi:cytochrome c biogenesis protein
VLIAAVLVLAGLVASLTVRRRRFWLRAVPAVELDADRRTVVHAAGLARNDPEGMGRELDALVQRMRG